MIAKVEVGKVIRMYGLGKNRSKLGRFIDNHGIKQGQLAVKAGVNKDTITKACTQGESVRRITKRKIIEALREITNKPLFEDDFW